MDYQHRNLGVIELTILKSDNFESGSLADYTLDEAGATIVTTRPRKGSNSVFCNPSSGVESVRQVVSPGSAIVVGKIYIYAEASENSAITLFEIRQTSPSRGVQIQCLTGPLRFALRGNVTGSDITIVDPNTSVVAVAEKAWYRFDLAINATADPWQVRWAVNHAEQTPASVAGGGAITINYLKFGQWGFLNSWNVYYDDFAYGNSMADYPIESEIAVTTKQSQMERTRA